MTKRERQQLRKAIELLLLDGEPDGPDGDNFHATHDDAMRIFLRLAHMKMPLYDEPQGPAISVENAFRMAKKEAEKA